MKTFTLTYPRHLLLVFILSLTGFLTLPSYASQPADHPHKDGMREHMRMADELNLSDSQRTAFKNAMKQMADTMHSGDELREQLRDLTEADKYDEKKVKELVHKHNSEMEKNMVSSSKAMHEFYTSLSPEQKTKFNEMRNDMKKKMKERMKGHMNRPCDDEESGDAGE